MKEDPMSKTMSFFCNFKHIGSIQIQIRENTATVISILGVCTYNFKFLPENRDNTNALLQLAFKAYLNKNIDNFDNLEPMKRPKTNIFDFFSKMKIPLTLDAGSYRDKIEGAIMKDFKEFEWSNVTSLELIENCEDITEVCIPSIVSRLYNFNEKSLFNLDIDKELSLIKPCKNVSSIEEISNTIKSFISVEIKGFEKIKQYCPLFREELGIEARILDGLIGCHGSILKKIHKMMCKFEGRQSIGFSNECNNRDLPNSYEKNAIVTLEDMRLVQNMHSEDHNRSSIIQEKYEVSSLENPFDEILRDSLDIILSPKMISQIFLESVDDLLIYTDFVREHEKVTDTDINSPLSVEYAFIMTHITRYFSFFKQLTEMSDELEPKLAFLQLQKFNKKLSDSAEKEILEKSVKKLASFHSSKKLNAKLSPMFLKDTVNFYLLDEFLIILDSKNNRLLAKMIVRNTDIFLYNKMIFAISDRSSIINIKYKNIEHTDLNMMIFDAVNREVTREFVDKFSLVKYKCSKFNEFLYSYEDNHAVLNQNNFTETSLNEIIIESIDQKNFKMNINSSDQEFKSKDEFYENLKCKIRAKKSSILKSQDTHYILSAILDETNTSKFIPFNIFTFVEEEGLFSRKQEILKDLSDLIILRRHSKSDIKIETNDSGYIEIPEFLINNDVLIDFSIKEQEYFIKKYISLILTKYETKSIVNVESLKELIYLFSMILQRNLYYFFDPEDHEKISIEDLFSIEAPNIEKIKSSYRKAFTSIRLVLLFLQKTSESEFIKIILKAIHK